MTSCEDTGSARVGSARSQRASRPSSGWRALVEVPCQRDRAPRRGSRLGDVVEVSPARTNTTTMEARARVARSRKRRSSSVAPRARWPAPRMLAGSMVAATSVMIEARRVAADVVLVANVVVNSLRRPAWLRGARSKPGERGRRRLPWDCVQRPREQATPMEPTTRPRKSASPATASRARAGPAGWWRSHVQATTNPVPSTRGGRSPSGSGTGCGAMEGIQRRGRGRRLRSQQLASTLRCRRSVPCRRPPLRVR